MDHIGIKKRFPELIPAESADDALAFGRADEFSKTGGQLDIQPGKLRRGHDDHGIGTDIVDVGITDIGQVFLAAGPLPHA